MQAFYQRLWYTSSHVSLVEETNRTPHLQGVLLLKGQQGLVDLSIPLFHQRLELQCCRSIADIIRELSALHLLLLPAQVIQLLLLPRIW